MTKKKLTFRIDDVSGNTDLIELRYMIRHLKDSFDCEVWMCVNPFSRQNFGGSVYPDPPFKDQVREFFFKVNQHFDASTLWVGQDRTVSHGLFHIDHSAIQYDAQEMSIVSSCHLLNTKTFVPPFNRYNQATETICEQNNITLVKSVQEGWLSLEHNEFDKRKALWYFHPWRFDRESFREAINQKDGKKLGLLQRLNVRRA